jgi:hypothetical protein
MAQPEQSEGEPGGCPLSGGAAHKSGPRGGTPTRNVAFEARHDLFFTTRGKWSSCQDLHLDLGLRTAV